ncbi:MAG: hypothetical protein ACFFAG_13300 [Promethearchaeota archaeon]
MKNLGKGFLALLIGVGVFLTPGLSIFSPEGFNEVDFETSEEKEEGLGKKVKPKKIIATIDIDPDKLNLKSKGKWITAYIELPIEFELIDIELDGILLNELLSPKETTHKIGDNDNDNIPDLMLKFDRSIVQSIVEVEGSQFCEITIEGQLVNGRSFKGSCEIEILGI